MNKPTLPQKNKESHMKNYNNITGMSNGLLVEYDQM